MALCAFYGSVACHKSWGKNALFTEPNSASTIPVIRAPTVCTNSGFFLVMEKLKYIKKKKGKKKHTEKLLL